MRDVVRGIGLRVGSPEAELPPARPVVDEYARETLDLMSGDPVVIEAREQGEAGAPPKARRFSIVAYNGGPERAKAWVEGYQEGMAKARIVYRDAIMAELGVANDAR